MNQQKRKLVGSLLAEVVQAAKSGGPKIRIGLMTTGSELGMEEFLQAATQAMALDSRLQVICLGQKPQNLPAELEWLETGDFEADAAKAMEEALQAKSLHGAVALHYPFPVGVTTIGRVFTPARGRPLLMASCTGASALHRPQAMLRNAIYGIAVAKALGQENPALGILNLEAAPQVQRALHKLKDQGYALHFGSSVRADGGELLRGNDLLAGSVDVCVADTLTGNVLMKMFAAFTSGGAYEAQGWGYGPSVGENWQHVVSIISRASGAPVIANALAYTAAAVRGNLPEKVTTELAAAKAAGLDAILAELAPKAKAEKEIVPPPAVPTNEEIHGVDVLDLEAAVHELWQAGIYAESAMGCTGPVVKLAKAAEPAARDILVKFGYL